MSLHRLTILLALAALGNTCLAADHGRRQRPCASASSASPAARRISAIPRGWARNSRSARSTRPAASMGMPLELVARDDKANPTRAAIAEELVLQKKADFTVGFCNTGVATKSLDVFQDQQAPADDPGGHRHRADGLTPRPRATCSGSRCATRCRRPSSSTRSSSAG